MQRQLAQVVTVERENVEGVELHLFVVPAGMEAVEIGDAVDAEQHPLAVEHEGCDPVAERGLEISDSSWSSRGRCG